MSSQGNVDKEFADIVMSLERDNPELVKKLSKPAPKKRAQRSNNGSSWSRLVQKCEQRWDARRFGRL